MNRHHFGVEISALYDASVADMAGRSTYRDRRGDLKVENVWDCIISKVSYNASPSWTDPEDITV